MFSSVGIILGERGRMCHLSSRTFWIELNYYKIINERPVLAKTFTSGALSFSRRKKKYETCSRFDLVLIEDEPYRKPPLSFCMIDLLEIPGQIYFRELSSRPHHNYSTQALEGQSTGYKFLDELVLSSLEYWCGWWTCQLIGYFSKTLAPGCRLGWVTAQRDVCEQLFMITDGTTQ